MRSGSDIDGESPVALSHRLPKTAGVILLLYSLLLVRFPLLNYLGYEYSVAISLAVPWIVGFRSIRILRAQGASPRSLIPLLKEGWMLLLIPLAVATANLIFVRNCSYGEGLLFFALIPGITVFWSLALASLCAAAVRRSTMVSCLWYSIAIMACFLYPLWIGYFSPQIFSYDFIYGYFPGISYDEVLTITPTLLLFRLLTVLTGVLLILLSRLLVRKSSGTGAGAEGSDGHDPAGLKALYGSSIALGILLILAWSFRVRLGFETTRDALERELPARYSTEHFRIFYSPESISPLEIGWIAALHEYRFAQVEAALQVRFHGTVLSYIYPDGDTKLRLIGTRTTNIAKPWRHEIHLEKNSLESTLKHELVHVVAGEFGLPVIRAHYNIGLVEGLAMAIDDGFGNRTLDQYAAAVKKFNLVPDPGRLITPVGFAMRASTVSYVLTGSFCKYLISRYGVVLFKRLYGGTSPEDVYGKSYAELVAEWQSRLDRIEVPDSWRNHVEYYFNRPSIFAKECAREVALRNEEGYRNLARNDDTAAMKDFSSALEASWNTESYAGLIRASFGAGRYDTVVHLVNSQAHDSASVSGITNMKVLYGDALWHTGNVDSARQAYHDVLSIDLSENMDEAASIRLGATADGELRAALPDIAAGRMNDSSAIQILRALGHHSKNPIVPYLEGRFLLRQRRFEEAISTLSSVAGRMDSPILNARVEQMIGETFFRLTRFQPARVHFWQSLNYVSNQASIDRIEDWLDRCEWFDKNLKKYLTTP